MECYLAKRIGSRLLRTYEAPSSDSDLSDGPDESENVPETLSNVPENLSSVPHYLLTVPENHSDVPGNQSDGSLSDPSDVLSGSSRYETCREPSSPEPYPSASTGRVRNKVLKKRYGSAQQNVQNLQDQLDAIIQKQDRSISNYYQQKGSGLGTLRLRGKDAQSQTVLLDIGETVGTQTEEGQVRGGGGHGTWEDGLAIGDKGGKVEESVGETETDLQMTISEGEKGEAAKRLSHIEEMIEPVSEIKGENRGGIVRTKKTPLNSEMIDGRAEPCLADDKVAHVKGIKPDESLEVEQMCIPINQAPLMATAGEQLTACRGATQPESLVHSDTPAKHNNDEPQSNINQEQQPVNIPTESHISNPRESCAHPEVCNVEAQSENVLNEKTGYPEQMSPRAKGAEVSTENSNLNNQQETGDYFLESSNNKPQNRFPVEKPECDSSATSTERSGWEGSNQDLTLDSGIGFISGVDSFIEGKNSSK